MKSVTISVLTIGCLFLTCMHVFAADDTLAGSFHRGNTYIRYHLAPDALQSQNDTTTTFTLTPRTIDAIDAYFECIPDVLPNQSIPEPRRFEVQWHPGVSKQSRYVLLSSATSAALPPAMAFWNIGNFALGFGYDEFSSFATLSDPWFSRPERQSIAGQLFFPLGETGFSFGASVLMHAAHMQWRANAAASPNLSAPTLSVDVSLPATMGYATAPASGNQLAAQSEDNLVQSTALSGTRNTVAGAVNVSGNVKGVQVFTEVGFASGAEEYDGVVLLNDDATVSNFYAVGGANYTVGQVTLGFEAGFENGEELLESESSLGFEHDFLVENLLPATQTEQLSDNKVYASVSAKLSPTERMMIGGAFRHIQPLDDGTLELYGFEVDGAFYYSLSSYLKYLAKAGISTLYNSLEESQYKIINSLELTF